MSFLINLTALFVLIDKWSRTYAKILLLSRIRLQSECVREEAEKTKAQVTSGTREHNDSLAAIASLLHGILTRNFINLHGF